MEHTAVVTACKSLCKPKTDPSIEKGIGHKILPFDKELLSILGFWERKGQFSPKSIGPGKLAIIRFKAIHTRIFGLAHIDTDGRKKTQNWVRSQGVDL